MLREGVCETRFLRRRMRSYPDRRLGTWRSVGLSGKPKPAVPCSGRTSRCIGDQIAYPLEQPVQLCIALATLRTGPPEWRLLVVPLRTAPAPNAGSDWTGRAVCFLRGGTQIAALCTPGRPPSAAALRSGNSGANTWSFRSLRYARLVLRCALRQRRVCERDSPRLPWRIAVGRGAGTRQRFPLRGGNP